MDHRFVSCPFCGFEFDRTDTLCSHGCPLGAACQLVRCPSCHYEFPERPRRQSFMSRLLRKNVPEPIGLPAEVIPATRVALGETAEVLCAGVENRGRLERLAVFGLVPGAEIEIIQQHPSCVIRIDETELALDREIGEEILVRLTKRGRAPSNAALAHPIDKQNS